MKTVEMFRDFNYTPHPAQTIAYKSGQTYERVPEAAVRAIILDDAGRVVIRDERG